MPSLKERFVGNPVNLDISRSKIKGLSHKNTLTFQPGKLVPILAYSDILPGDTWSLNCSFVCRSTTPLAPVMDDAYIQVEFYFVPSKLVLSRAYMSPQLDDSNRSFEAMIGAQDSLLNMPLPDPTIKLPSLFSSGDTWASIGGNYKVSLAHYLGIPFHQQAVIYSNDPGNAEGNQINVPVNPISMLSFYALWNENYREPNIWSPVVFSVDDHGYIVFSGDSHSGVDEADGGNIFYNTLPDVCREHGYFGSALPWPQRNSETVKLPLGDMAPVITGVEHVWFDDGNIAEPLKMRAIDGTFIESNLEVRNAGTPPTYSYLAGTAAEGGAVVNSNPVPTNLWTDLSTATAASVNALRFAIQLQRLYEAWARGGNRIQDFTQIFGVTPHDMGDDRPEYLGGKRIPLSQTQVNATAGTSYSTTAQASLGSTGAFSNTADSDHYFSKSFDTWGCIIGVCLVRHHDSFANMMPKMLRRMNRLDYYWPQFANLGEQPVYKTELSFGSKTNGPTNKDNMESVFGYQEAYADYRYIPDSVHGEVNPEFGTIGYWTYANSLSDLVGEGGWQSLTLGSYLDASNESRTFDRTLQVSSATAGFTFLAQFYFDITAVRPMPLYSIPGLMDHH